MQKMTLKELQNYSLEILKSVHSFCKGENIKYSLAYGTLIGAIRHKGFIPWDDDIDIIMPRQDYIRFCQTYKSDKYKLVSSYCEESWLAFSRVCDVNETYADTISQWGTIKTGVWIDIFPVDGVEDDFNLFQKRVDTCHELWMKQQYYRDARHNFDLNRGSLYNVKLVVKKIIRKAGRDLEKTNKALKEKAIEIRFGQTNHWSQLACMDDGDKNYQEIKDFSSIIEVPFEGTMFYSMNGYDRFLRNIYGDYMQMPPIENQVPKQDYITFYWKNK